MKRFLTIATVFILLFCTKGSIAEGNRSMDKSKITNAGQIRLKITNFGCIGDNDASDDDTWPSCEYPAGSGIDYLRIGGLWCAGLLPARVDRMDFDSYDPSYEVITRKPWGIGSSGTPHYQWPNIGDFIDNGYGGNLLDDELANFDAGNTENNRFMIDIDGDGIRDSLAVRECCGFDGDADHFTLLPEYNYYEASRIDNPPYTTDSPEYQADMVNEVLPPDGFSSQDLTSTQYDYSIWRPDYYMDDVYGRMYASEAYSDAAFPGRVHIPMGIKVVRKAYSWSDSPHDQFVGLEIMIYNDRANMPFAMDGDDLEECEIDEQFLTDPDEEGRRFDARRNASHPYHDEWEKWNTIREFYTGYFIDADIGPQTWNSDEQSMDDRVGFSENVGDGGAMAYCWDHDSDGGLTNDGVGLRLLDGFIPDADGLPDNDGSDIYDRIDPADVAFWTWAKGDGFAYWDNGAPSDQQKMSRRKLRWHLLRGSNNQEFPEQLEDSYGPGGGIRFKHAEDIVQDPDDVRFLLSFGGFDLAPGDSARILLGLILGGFSTDDYINGTQLNTELFENARYAMQLFNPTGITNDTKLSKNCKTKLMYNYPNPFNPETIIGYSLNPQATDAELTVYNVMGQLVKTWSFSELSGNSSVVWNGQNQQGEGVGSGIYFYRLSENGEVKETRKMILLK